MSLDILNNEAVLLLRMAEGDEVAFARMVKLYSPKLFSYILRLTRNSVIAEEIVQDIFVQLWQIRETLADVKNLDAWLFVLSRNAGANELKKIARQRLQHIKWMNGLSRNMESEPGDALLQYENLVDQAVSNLPPQQQKAWVMSRHKRMKYAEIATEMNISQDMVKQHIKAANVNILKYLQKHKDALLLILFLALF